MLRALLLLASFMIIAGAAAIINGSSMILNERGWSQLIAGSVVLTGGFIVTALAGLLYEMQSLWAAKRVEPMADTAQSLQAAEPSQLPDITAHDTHRARDDVRSTAFYEKASSQPHQQQAQPREEAVPVLADPHPEMIDITAPVVVSLPTADYDQIKPLDQPSGVIGGVQFSPEPNAASREAAVPRPQLKQPSLFEMVQDQQQGYQQQGYQQQGYQQQGYPNQDYGAAPFAQPQSHPSNTGDVRDSSATQDLTSSAHPAQPKERILLASYSTGGVGYFMYSDQSIEAEMAIGRYRFRTMDELRHFIETQTGGERVSD